MVKLEAISGRDVLVQPSRVLAIEHAAHHGNSVIHLGTGINVVVKGTPDEVHAKLFPETEFSRVRERASHDVLMWVIEDCKDAHAGVIGSARLALGLET